jgi:transcriptional regulator with XRE-family HTH domain
MKLREIVGLNLRRLCEKEPSIASVCRALEVTPQQFNNYLNGRHLPNEDMIERICEKFGIEEETLYLTPNAQAAANLDTDIQLTRHLRLSISQLRKAEFTSLPDGLHFIYQHVLHDPKYLVKSAMYVKTLDGIKTFRRVTSVNKRASAKSREFRSDHFGIVCQPDATICYLVASDARAAHRVSFMALRWSLTSTPMLIGHANIESLNGAAIAKVAVMPSAKMSIRECLSQLRAYSIDDKLVPSEVLEALGSFD